MNSNSDECKILNLPTELLMKIFSYVRRRDEVCLVCQQFYEIICLLEKDLYRVNIRDKRMVNLK